MVGSVPSALAILERLQQEQIPEVQTKNLQAMMANVSACIETLSDVLKSKYDVIVSQWMEDHKSSVGGEEKSFKRLFYLAMRAKGNVDWFRPNGGETFF